MQIPKKLEDLIFQIFIEKPHTFQGLLALIFFLTAIFLCVHSSIKDDFDYEWIMFILFYGGALIWWLLFKYLYPKNNRTQTGLVIALYACDAEALKLKRKFVRELKKYIHTASLHKIFKIIELKNHHAELVDIDRMKKIDNIIDGHFYIYGDIQKESDGKYYINLDGYVTHKPVGNKVVEELSFDFQNVLPKEINFKDIFEYNGIKVTSKITYLAARYIVGVASFISGNPFLAYKLHTGLETEFEYKKIENEISKSKGKITKFDLKYLHKLKTKVPKIISNEAVVMAKIFFLNNKLDDCKKCLDIAQVKNPANYSLWLLKAIIEFILQPDDVKAMECVKKAEQYSNGLNEWRYSKVFLLFWNKKITDAYREAQKITKHSYPHEQYTVSEVEDFIIKILEKNDQKPQLFFWLGYIMIKKRKDLVLAKVYFEKFLLLSGGSLKFLEEKTRNFLVDLKNVQVDYS